MINSTNDCQLTKTKKKTLVGSYKNDDKNHHQTHMLNISPLNRFPPFEPFYFYDTFVDGKIANDWQLINHKRYHGRSFHLYTFRKSLNRLMKLT